MEQAPIPRVPFSSQLLGTCRGTECTAASYRRQDKMVSGTNDVVLLIGGARSGKSRLALARAEARAGELVYVATGEALDAEMVERVALHRAQRGPRWRTVEAPLDLPGAVARESGAAKVLVVDCLTLWLSNLVLGERDV